MQFLNGNENYLLMIFKVRHQWSGSQSECKIELVNSVGGNVVLSNGLTYYNIFAGKLADFPVVHFIGLDIILYIKQHLCLYRERLDINKTR